MRLRAEARFTGKVQGVYFRDYTRRYASELGVTGWVKNMPDRSVRAVFEGERADIEEVVRRLREEHPSARVDEVELEWSDFTGEFRSFVVEYRD